MWFKLADGKYQDVDVAGADRIVINRPARRKLEPLWDMAITDMNETTFYYRIHGDYVDAIIASLDKIVITQPYEERD